MLFELEPSREITGGAWYTEHEYDSEFIGVLRQQARWPRPPAVRPALPSAAQRSGRFGERAFCL